MRKSKKKVNINVNHVENKNYLMHYDKDIRMALIKATDALEELKQLCQDKDYESITSTKILGTVKHWWRQRINNA